MKSRVIVAGLFSLLVTATFAQVEQDDMYFNSKDRAKLRDSRNTAAIAMRENRGRNSSTTTSNPTDSYSARNINPEYISRSGSDQSSSDEEDYYVDNYRFRNEQDLNNWNNNFNNWYGNSWARPNYWGPSINAWNSPYYGFADPWNSPWYDPYWSNNGFSSGFSFHYGPTWNYGWGGAYNYWNRPYCPTAWSFYGNNGYWNNYRYPNVIVVNPIDGNGRQVVHGRRPTRGSSIVYDNDNRLRNNDVNGNIRPADTNGRVRTRNQSQDYNNLRNSNNTNSNRNAAPQNDRRWYNNSSSGSNDTFSAPTRSSSSGFGSGSSGSSGVRSSGGGGGSNGRSRGGN